MNSIKIKVLANNRVNQPGLLAEHGLAFWIKTGREEYLFDTGQGLGLESNARQLGIDLTELTGVIISHGHYDHGGGLEKLLTYKPELGVYAHPQIFRDRYSAKQDGLVFNGLTITRSAINNFIPTTNPTTVNKQLTAVGEIPRQNDWELMPKKYKMKWEDNLLVDDFKDDQALVIETNKETVVILGCTHAGVVNTLEYIQELTSKPISTVLGGMHLNGAREGRINKVVDYLADLDLDLVVPLHCTGARAVNRLINNQLITVQLGEVGSEFDF